MLDEVVHRARLFEDPTLLVYSKLSSPPDLDEALQRRGAELVDTCDVLAMALGRQEERKDIHPLTGVELAWRTTPDIALSIARIVVEAFGGALPEGPELVEAMAQRARDGQEALDAGRGGVLLPTLDGTPVGTAGVEIVHGVARFGGGSVREPYRGRGIYRQLVDARVDYATRQGASMALSFGRVETSSPILRRMGFSSYGQERMYRPGLH